jgi:hypothetical protein
MHTRVSAETLNALRVLDCCSVANAVEAFDVRLRNEVFSKPRIPDIASDPREREKQIIAYSRSAEFSVAGAMRLSRRGGRG